MNLKNQLKLFLELRGKTASQLARESKVPKQTISTWLSGSIARDPRQLKRVADVLGTSMDNLIFGNGVAEDQKKITDLGLLFDDGWLGGLFEIKLRRVKR